jgi:hypothetical protein
MNALPIIVNTSNTYLIVPPIVYGELLIPPRYSIFKIFDSKTANTKKPANIKIAYLLNLFLFSS